MLHYLFRPKTKFWFKKPTSLHEKKTGWALIFNFLCGHPHGADMPSHPPPLVCMRPPEPGPTPPSCGHRKWMAPCSIHLNRVFCLYLVPTLGRTMFYQRWALDL